MEDTPKKSKLHFIPIESNQGNFLRAKVPGGWLIMSESNVCHRLEQGMHSGWDWRVALVFIPDPTHVWEVK